MRTITYTNDLGESVVFPTDARIFFKEQPEGLDGTSLTVTTTQAYRQHGTTWRYSQLDERDIVLNFGIDCLNHEDYMATRKQILSAFKPLTPGTLYYEDENFDVMLPCHVRKSPQLDIWVGATGGEGSVELVAPDPVFYDRVETLVQITSWEGGWRHKWSGRFRLRQRGQTAVTVTNSGQLPVPVEVSFHGPATRPIVRNVTTGEYILVDTTLTSTETMTIRTHYHDKTVRITDEGGTERYAEQYISDASSFFWLQPGENQIRYSSDLYGQVNDVQITYRRGFYSV